MSNPHADRQKAQQQTAAEASTKVIPSLHVHHRKRSSRPILELHPCPLPQQSSPRRHNNHWCQPHRRSRRNRRGSMKPRCPRCHPARPGMYGTGVHHLKRLWNYIISFFDEKTPAVPQTAPGGVWIETPLQDLKPIALGETHKNPGTEYYNGIPPQELTKTINSTIRALV